MESSDDKQWASKYLLDPLTAPEPSQETGPGTHLNTKPDHTGFTRPKSTSSTMENKQAFSISRRPVGGSPNSSYPSPPVSASSSPRLEKSSHRREAFGGSESGSASQRASSEIPTSTTGRRRNSSLFSRFDGDQSHRPLDIIRRDVKLANRAPHLRKSHFVGPDSIDNLDTVGGAYHHEGPFDATLLAKNISSKTSPVAAVRDTNLEALKATPREMIQDSIERHRPLDGVATIPPGMIDENGRVYHYEEGTDMMIENGGNYKRWPGVTYLPEDLKGKGEPSYSIEKALKKHKMRRRTVSDGDSGIEMTATRPRPSSSGSAVRPPGEGQRYADWEGEFRRSSSGGGLLRKRFGSLRKK